METRRPRKGDVTREALMTAAFKVFAAKGFLRTTVGDVVREAGKSTGVFHVYFRNKDALLDAWLERCDQMVPWYQADTGLLFEKARFFTLESYWALYERYGPVMRALEDAARVSEHFAEQLAERQQKGDAGIARMIRHVQRDGRCLGVDAELTAVSLGAMMSRTTAYWFEHRAALEARGFDGTAALAHLEGLYSRMLEPETVASAATAASPAGVAPTREEPSKRATAKA